MTLQELYFYKIKIEFTEMEIESILNSLNLDYYSLIDRDPHLNENACDLNLGMRIFEKAARSLQQRLVKYSIEGKPTKRKPIKVSMSKLDMIWLYNYLSMAELVELEHQRLEIGKYIFEFIN